MCNYGTIFYACGHSVIAVKSYCSFARSKALSKGKSKPAVESCRFFTSEEVKNLIPCEDRADKCRAARVLFVDELSWCLL